MHLTTRTRYGSRALVSLATARLAAADQTTGDDLALTTAEIAAQQEISPKYLERLLAMLRDAGLVRTLRGSQGGHLLARAPEQITLRQVYEVLEGPEALVPCTRDPQLCARCDTCPTRGLWAEMHAAAMGVLERTTLADLTIQTHRL